MSHFGRLALAIATLAAPLRPSKQGHGHTLTLNMHDWHVLTRDSGPIDYYTLHRDPSVGLYLHADYRPAFETTTLVNKVPEDLRQTFHRLSWTWRAVTLPKGGNECADGKEDSAAVVYATWHRGLKYYSVKFVWSAVGPKGTTCDHHGGLFHSQDTVILESGGPLDTWKTESIDLDAAFRKHFADGDPKADVPDFVGLGILTDGDQTHSRSSADYGKFVLATR